jgi:ligand-binding sensor domain-containing protein/signal transduction histidine kinase
VFKLDETGRLCHRWRMASNGAWSSWSELGGSLSPGLAIVSNTNGEMEIFGVDRNSRALECIHQLATNSLQWSAWTNLGGWFESPVAACRNEDGRIEVFAVDAATHGVKHLWQIKATGGWSAWADLGGSVQPGLAVTRNQDGRLELFGIGDGDDALLHCWQLRSNTTNEWSAWASLGGMILPGFVVGQNVSNRVDVFAVNPTNDTVNRICQMAPGDSTNWTAWEEFGPEVKPGLAVGQSGDGRMEVFAVNATNSAVLHRWELFTHGSDQWSAWADLGAKSGTTPAVGVNEDGDLEVFATDPANPNVIQHRRQISSASDWLDWSSLDQPVFAYASRSWQVDEGLPDNVVQAITQTADGFLWAGTRGGLARFDGSQFVSYDARNTPALKNSSITALCAGKDGSLWIGTDGGGLVRLKGGVFTQFAQTNGLAGDKVQVIYESRDGSLWIGTTTGMSCYRNGQFRTYSQRGGLLSDVVRCIYEDRDGNLWIATGKGLNRLRPAGTMDAFTMPNGLPNDSVRVICQDQGGRIWIGSNNGLLWYNWFWGNGFYAYNTKYGLSDSFVSAICEDDESNLWVGTYSGLNRFRDGRFYSQPDSDGQPFDKVNALFVDREGDLWVGSKEGLTRMTPKRFFTYTKQQGLTHNNVMSVLEDPRGALWIGTWGGGLDEMQGEKITADPAMTVSTNGISQDLILSLCEGRDGSLWVGADFDGGLTRLKDGRTTHYTWRDGLINAGLRVLHEDAAGNLWIGTDRGLSCFRHGGFLTNLVTEHLAGESIRDICEDKSGALWFATQNGLCRWQDGQFTRFTTANGLSDDALTALHVDAENTLWVGTSGGGLNRYRNGRFTAYTTRQGLFSDEIFGILDDRGWLWMSCSRGIFRVRIKDLDAFDAGKIESIASLVYGKSDGMESPQCNGGGRPSAWKSRDGWLWFPTSKGLVSVDPKTLKLDREPPSVFIETVVADQKTIAGGRFTLAGASSVLASRSLPLHIPPGRGELEFQYAALDFSAPQKARFKYRLEGVDSQWIDAGVRRIAYYNNLAPGSYHFQVRACNKDGVWNEAGASMSVILVPHYWQTLWFRGLMVVTILGSACGLALYATRRRMQRKLARLEQQHAVERERGRIAKDMHDQIGAGLTQIGLLGEFARRATEKDGDAKPHAEKICETARELAQTLDEIVWMVNPKNDTLNKLGLYLAAYAEEFFEATTIRCRLDVPPDLPPCPLSAELRHNLFLTVKEALNNIVKHSRASEARLRFSLNDSTLEIDIEDDGVGFPVDAANAHRNGLSNMQERMKEIGGRLQISNRPNNGTRVCLRIPINNVRQ